ncbi:MAG: flavin-containing monooxygenase [Solirubrobacteraceae bacterium]
MAFPDHEVVIVGGGFSGIGAAIALRRAGFDDLLIIEDGDGVGGAWHWNTYPGVAVDIPSFSYQFSYRQRADWSRVYAPGSELKAYAEHLVDTYDLRPKLRLSTRVTSAVFDDDRHLWRLGTAAGDEITARHVIDATGVLTQPKPPEIAGLESFEGTTLHTARWDHDLDLFGKRVAVVGTGASAVQLIPSIAPDVAQLTVFQRTPIWCMPKLDAPMPRAVQLALKWVPGAKWATRLASQAYVELTFPISAHFATVLPLAKRGEQLGLAFLRDQVKDPETRDKLTPRYGLGCKRPSFSNEYLATFNRANVHLETTPIAEITPTGVRTTDGVQHEIDVLVLATGFKVFEAGNMPPYPVTGRDGADLGAFWEEHRYQAYEGASVPRFPNLFMILGPYGYNGSSYFTLIENQMRHIVRALVHARDRGATRVEVREEANERYFREMLARRPRQVFFQGTCSTANSYYFDRHGDVPLRPATTLEARWRSARYDLDDYRFERAA